MLKRDCRDLPVRWFNVLHATRLECEELIFWTASAHQSLRFLSSLASKAVAALLDSCPSGYYKNVWFRFLHSASQHGIRVWKTSSIIPIHKMGKPLDSPAPFRSISLTSCVSKLFERIILSRLLFFLESNSILSPRQAGFRPGGSTLDQIPFLRVGLTNPDRALVRSIPLFISLKLLTLSGIPPFTINLFLLASLLALLVGLNLSFLIGALAWFIKITKVVPFESVEVFHKDPFLALYFSLFSSMIFRFLCLLPSAALFTLTIWPFDPPPLGPHCGGGLTKSSVSIGALV